MKRRRIVDNTKVSKEEYKVKMALKTKEVSRELDVNPTTVQRWVKYFDIPCKKNDLGHYLFDDTSILHLKQIKQQLSLGLPMAQVELTHTFNPKAKQNEPDHNIQTVLSKLEEMANRLEFVETQLEEKATNVVNVQLLQHRRELEGIYKTVDDMKATIENLKMNNSESQVKHPFKANKNPKRKRKWQASFLNLF